MQPAQEMAGTSTALERTAMERVQLVEAQAAETFGPQARAFGWNGQKALLEAWTGQRSTQQGTRQGKQDFYDGFALYYQAGLTGENMSQVYNRYAWALTEPQKQAAYHAGRQDAAAFAARGRSAAAAPVDTGIEADYNGDEGGSSYGDQLEETFGDHRRSEGAGQDAGRTGAEAGADKEGAGGIPAWAEGAQVQKPGEPAKQAVKTAQSYGVRAVVVQDAAIKARNSSALALTEGGVVYLSNALTEEDAKTVVFHEAVHAVKQRGSAAYESFLENTGGELDFHSDRTMDVMDLVTDSRFPGQEFMSLTEAQQRTVFDELNALIWGCHKADPQNARAQFQDVFIDYDSYIKELDRIMEAERQDR